jgi:hypothetical protein
MVIELKHSFLSEVVVEQLIPATVVVVYREDQFGLAVIAIVPGVYEPHAGVEKVYLLLRRDNEPLRREWLGRRAVTFIPAQ